MSMRVRAVQRGFYGGCLRRPGDVFDLQQPADFSHRWMVRVDDSVPLCASTAQQFIEAQFVERTGRPISRPNPEAEDTTHALCEWEPFRQ